MLNFKIITVFLLLIICGGVAMGITDIGKVCLFSNMTGIITIDGEPVANARLVRTVDLSSEKTDETKTDQYGKFEFPTVFARTITKHLPQEFASKQEIVAHVDGKPYTIWSGVKRTPEENSESRGKPLVVTCELNSEETLIKGNNSPIFSLCSWDVEPDKQRKAF
jgi:hypothetical protein